MARAQDRFEVQVYDSEVSPPGTFGLELHANYVFVGTTEVSEDGELPTQHSAHFILEPHVGLADWCEVGGYLQAALLPDSFRYAGFKLRVKLRAPGRLWGVLGAALNLELAVVPPEFEASTLATEVRPVIDVRAGPFYASVNPILAFDLMGSLAGRPQFEPAAKVALTVLPGLSLGAEYYGGWGPITGPREAPPAHILYGALDFTSAYFDLNAGFGGGVSGDERWVAKVILGFHPREAPPEHESPGPQK